MEILLIIGLCLAAGALIFWLGFTARAARNQKFQTTINQAYKNLIEDNRKMANSPVGIARAKGYSDGYEQGVADSHSAIEKLIRSDPIAINEWGKDE